MKFLTDRTTGKLAKKLRALGLDVADWRQGRTEEAARAALAEGRIFLTRSRRIPALGQDLRVTIVEADRPREQVREVLQKLCPETPEENRFSRCLLCNEGLLPVPKGEVEGRVPDFIFRGYDSFRTCPRCSRVYWSGTHLEKMRKEADRILSGEDEAKRGITLHSAKSVIWGKEAEEE